MSWYRLPALFNAFEVVLWPTLGAILAAHGWRRGVAVRRHCLIAAAVLLLFGLSDLAEALTGNQWWHPWWLLLWKAACVTALAGLALGAYLRRRASRP